MNINSEFRSTRWTRTLLLVFVCISPSPSCQPTMYSFNFNRHLRPKAVRKKGTREQARPVSPINTIKRTCMKMFSAYLPLKEAAIQIRWLWGLSFSFNVSAGALLSQTAVLALHRATATSLHWFFSEMKRTRKVMRLRAVGHTSAEWRQRAAIYGPFESFSGNLVSHCFSWQPKQKSYFQSLNFFRICSCLVEVICLS